MAIIISIASATFGYFEGRRQGYIHALIDKMNNTKPKYFLTEKEDKQVVWAEDLNYTGISRVVKKGNLHD
jgi:hypothetical protein